MAKEIFIPHELKTLEIDTERRIFRVNGEDFGKGCTGFQIICNRYDSFDIRVEIDTTVKYATIRDGCTVIRQYQTDAPWFGNSEEDPGQIEKPT